MFPHVCVSKQCEWKTAFSVESLTTLLAPKEKGEYSIVEKGRDPGAGKGHSGECGTVLAEECVSV